MHPENKLQPLDNFTAMAQPIHLSYVLQERFKYYEKLWGKNFNSQLVQWTNSVKLT